MSTNQVINPYEYFMDFNQGRPIFNGQIFVGLVGTDPEVQENQKDVTFSDACDCPEETVIMQPIRTSSGGVPIYNGSPVRLFVEGAYSLKVNDRNGVQVYYSPDVTKGVPLTIDDAVTPINTISDLRAYEPLIDDQQISLLGHTISGVGGGRFYFDPEDKVSDDNNGSIIVTPNNNRWKRPEGDFNAADFGVIYGLPDDQSLSINLAIAAADESGAYVIIDGDVFANISTSNISIRISGGGTVKAFSRSLNVISASSSFNAPTSVTSVSTVTQTIGGRIDTRVTRVEAPGNALKEGAIIKLVSEDLIPTLPTVDDTRSGEWAVVLEVAGDYVFLDRVLEQIYITSPRIAEIGGKVCDISISIESTTGNASSGAALCSLKGFLRPLVDISVSNNDGLGLLLVGTYGASCEVSVKNLTDNNAINSFGYGVTEAGTASSSINIFQTGFCRHAYTTGIVSNSQEIYTYGEPWGSTISGKAEGCTAAAWDTHAEGTDLTFLNVESNGSRALLQFRGKRILFLNPCGDSNYTAISAINTTSTMSASGEVVGINATRCTKPINVKDQSATGNPIGLRISGNSLISYTPASPSAAIDDEADISIFGSLELLMLGGTDFNVWAHKCGEARVYGDITFNTTAGNASQPFSMNSDFSIMPSGSVTILSQSISKLFTSSTSEAASTTNISAPNMEINVELLHDNWFKFAFANQDIQLFNSFNDARSSNRLFFNTSGGGAEIVFDSLDTDLITIMSTQPAPDNIITGITDGKRVGQTLTFDNGLARDLEIPNTIPNVANSVTIPGAGAGSLFWDGAKWVG